MGEFIDDKVIMDSWINPGTFILLAIIPALIYLIYYDIKREGELKKKPFFRWYFFFEYMFFLAWGQVAVFICGIIFFRDYWAKNLPIIVLVFMGVLCLGLVWWLRSGFLFSLLPMREFKPFLREIMGKNPYPDSGNHVTTDAKPTRLCIGCSASLIPLVIALIMLVVAWCRNG